MVQLLLVRSGSTEWDEQQRIKGTTDLPLSEMGAGQAARLVEELHEHKIDYLYASPCRCASETAAQIARDHRLKVKPLSGLQNLDHGLWHGKRIDELRQSQPRLFRQLMEHPETVCPPEGEPIGDAVERVREAIAWIRKKHPLGVVALVVPGPVAKLVQGVLGPCELGDLWRAECDCGDWCAIDLEREAVAGVRS